MTIRNYYEKCYKCLQKIGVCLLLEDLVANIVDIGWKVMLGMVVNDVTNICEHYFLKNAFLQVFQKPVRKTTDCFVILKPQ